MTQSRKTPKAASNAVIRGCVSMAVALMGFGCDNPQLSYIQLEQRPGASDGGTRGPSGRSTDTGSADIESTGSLVIEPPSSTHGPRDASVDAGSNGDGLSDAGSPHTTSKADAQASGQKTSDESSDATTAVTSVSSPSSSTLADAGANAPDADTGTRGILCDCPEELNPCLLALCVGGLTICTFTPQPGAACDDGDPCTVSDQCDAKGACGGEPKDCSGEDDVCYEGVCNEGSGKCEAKPSVANTACSDGDKCTSDDVCDGKGECVGKALDCSELDSSCTEGTCDADSGECVARPSNEGKSCNDEDKCTRDDVCKDGVCGGNSVDCSDQDGACTVGMCDPKNGNCKAEPLSDIACDDEDSCTVFDACDNGKCKGQKADDCKDPGRLDLSMGSTSITMSNTCARDDFDVRSMVPRGSDCVRSAGNDVVFSLDLSDFDEAVTLRASTINDDTTFDTVLFIMTQQCSKDPPIACVDDADDAGFGSALEVQLEPGLYALVVDSYRGNERGTFRLDVEVD